MTSDLNHRSRKILHAVVSEYLQTGEAVGSRTITRRHGIDLSPATVRNVMADLEEMGLLEQPHTSSGRVPTGSGLRFFIDSLLKVRSLSPKEKEEIRERFGASPPDLDDVMQTTSRLLSDLTHYAGIVLAPKPARQRLGRLEFVPLSQSRFLCILVTADGLIQNRLVQLDGPIDAAQLDRIHHYLNRLLEGVTLEELRQTVLRELGDEKNSYDAMVGAALRLGQAAFDRPRGDAGVIVTGSANLLDPDNADPEELGRMRSLLHALEEKELIVQLLDRTIATERIQVYLGAETEIDVLADTAVVAVPYGPGDRAVGAIAVIGPTRMNYGKVISVVDFTADLVSELMTGK
jgi:heat-inducible transcriptional repressor